MISDVQRQDIELAISSHNIIRAKKLIKETFEHPSTNPTALNYLGQVFTKEGMFADAIRHLAYANKLEPKNVKFALDLTKVLVKRKKYKKAADTLNGVLLINPNNAEATSLLKAVESNQDNDNIIRNHVVITGTGRAGTTLLVKILTKLNLNTGFSLAQLDNKTDKNSRAGLEQNILKNAKCSYVVKSPLICDQIEEISQRPNIIIDHAFIPIRNIKAAALSRLKVYKDGGKKEYIPGGIWQTSDPNQQEEILTDKLFNLLLGLAKMDVPVTLLHYPKLTRDSNYLYKKLLPILPNISLEHFTNIFNSTVDRNLVNKLTENDR